ncbi:MAG: hypothetical protein WB439_04530 [Acidobacteriaceae bacterium]
MKQYPKYLDWIRYICALLLYFYGVSKLTGHQLVVPSWVAQRPIGSLDGYTLTWYYFGYSHTYKYILGSLQVTCASLLLFRKSALLAAVMMVPVMVNIVLINIFYSITAGAERTAVFILGCMLLLLWHEREALFEVLWTSQSTELSSAQKRHWFIRALVLLFVLGEVLLGTVMAHHQGFFSSLHKGH